MQSRKWWFPHSAAPILIVADIQQPFARSTGAMSNVVARLMTGDYNPRYSWAGNEVRLTIMSPRAAIPALPVMAWEGVIPEDLPERFIESAALEAIPMIGANITSASLVGGSVMELALPAHARFGALPSPWCELFRTDAIADFVIRRDEIRRLMEIRRTDHAVFEQRIKIRLHDHVQGVLLPDSGLRWELLPREETPDWAADAAREELGLRGANWGEIRSSAEYSAAIRQTEPMSAVVCKGWFGLMLLQLACRPALKPVRTCALPACSEPTRKPRAAYCLLHAEEREKARDRSRK